MLDKIDLDHWFSKWGPRSFRGPRSGFSGTAKRLRSFMLHMSNGSINQGKKFSLINKSVLLTESVIKGLINAQWGIVRLKVNYYVILFSITPKSLMLTKNKNLSAS